MSSHHFVKEGQEPALFILEASSFDHVGPLLEWAPLVICSSQALERVLSWGIKVDVVIGTANEEDWVKQQMTEFMQIRYLLRSESVDVYDVLFRFLVSEKQLYVNVVGASPHNLISFYQQHHGNLHVGFISPSHRWVVVAGGHFRKWFPSDIILQIYGQHLQTEGLIPLDFHSWRSLENGFVSVQSNALFWVGEPL